jgi:hypothetical protein
MVDWSAEANPRDTGIIVGCSIGGVVGLLLTIGIFYKCYRSFHRKKELSSRENYYWKRQDVHLRPWVQNQEVV